MEDYTGRFQSAGTEGIVGGSPDGTKHEKYRDQEGQVWLFKEYPKSYFKDRRHRALADEFVYQMALRLGFNDAVPVFAGRIRGGSEYS